MESPFCRVQHITSLRVAFNIAMYKYIYIYIVDSGLLDTYKTSVDDSVTQINEDCLGLSDTTRKGGKKNER